MADDRRENNAQILLHMGRVEKHMEDDAVFKQNYLKVETRVGKAENRLTKVETKQGFILKGGYVAVASVIAFFTKGYWMKH